MPSESRILTDAEVEFIEQSIPTPSIDALITWGRHWKARAIAAEQERDLRRLVELVRENSAMAVREALER